MEAFSRVSILARMSDSTRSSLQCPQHPYVETTSVINRTRRLVMVGDYPKKRGEGWTRIESSGICLRPLRPRFSPVATSPIGKASATSSRA